MKWLSIHVWARSTLCRTYSLSGWLFSSSPAGQAMGGFAIPFFIYSRPYGQSSSFSLPSELLRDITCIQLMYTQSPSATTNDSSFWSWDMHGTSAVITSRDSRPMLSEYNVLLQLPGWPTQTIQWLLLCVGLRVGDSGLATLYLSPWISLYKSATNYDHPANGIPHNLQFWARRKQCPIVWRERLDLMRQFDNSSRSALSLSASLFVDSHKHGASSK